MHLGINYRIRNTVVEYKKNELIAWKHLGQWRWRYELVDLGNGSTQVTETFDGSYAPGIAQTWLNFRKAYPWTQIAVAKTLVRLKSVAEGKQNRIVNKQVSIGKACEKSLLIGEFLQDAERFRAIRIKSYI